MKPLQRIEWKEIIGILICGLIFGLFIFYVEDYILTQFVVTPANVTIESWLSETFHLWAVAGIGFAFLMVFLWYLLGARISIRRYQDAGKRLGWWVLFSLLTIMLLVSVYFTRAQEGAWLAHILYALNIFGFYYFATALFSPAAIKYSPPGSQWLRKSW
jgi:hypothetical protein